MIIRANKGMIRDVFIDAQKDEGPVLAIRQIKFDDNGGHLETKMIRLTTEEANAVMEFWAKEGNG